jgi:spermidine synthase
MTTPIDISEQDGVRYLHFGSNWVQGAMRIARPWKLELEYTREMMVSLLMRHDSRWPRRVLLIGLGTASLTKFLYRYRPLSHLTIVEIEPSVVVAARHFFKLPDDDRRIHMITGDGADYILGADKKFDLILVDGFNEHAHPGQLNSLPFYQACRSRLTDDGILSVNLLGLSKGVLGGYAHIQNVFGQRSLRLPSCESGNTIAFGAEGEQVVVNLDDWINQAEVLKKETGLNLLPTIGRLASQKGQASLFVI